MSLIAARPGATWAVPTLAPRPLRVGAAFLAAFVVLAALVGTRRLGQLDLTLMALAKWVIAPQLDVVVGIISYLAAGEISLLLMASLATWLWRRGLPPSRAIAPLVFLASVPIEIALKYSLDQPVPGSTFYRQTIRYALFGLPSPMSFPSGHATRTAFMCVLASYLLVRLTGATQASLAIVPLALLGLVAGWSRVYLGYHWPTDVIGGVLLGTAGACLAIALLEPVLKQRARSA